MTLEEFYEIIKNNGISITGALPFFNLSESLPKEINIYNIGECEITHTGLLTAKVTGRIPYPVIKHITDLHPGINLCTVNGAYIDSMENCAKTEVDLPLSNKEKANLLATIPNDFYIPEIHFFDEKALTIFLTALRRNLNFNVRKIG